MGMDNFFKILKHKYQRMPWIVRFPVSLVYCFIGMLYNLLKPCTWLIRSRADENHDSVGLMFCGDFQEKNYVVRMTFAEDCAQTELGRVWIWQIKKLIKRHQKDIDFLMYDVPRRVSMWLGNRRCFCIPAWIQGDMDFSLIDFNSGIIKADIRRIRNKYAYTFEVARDRDSLYRFYNEMYLPYIPKRYGKETLLGDFEDILRESKNWEILFVKKGETFISGYCYYYYKDGSVMLRYVGVNAGDENLVKSGAIQALYYFLFNHLKDKECRRISAGGSRPFFGDGVLNYKKKWGLRLTHCKHNVMRVYPLRDTRGARTFLVNNPCIALDGEDLVGIVFVDQIGEITLEDIKTRYLWPGLKRVIVYCFDDSRLAACDITEESSVVVRSTKELFV